jgi:hypothetical protein
MKTVLERFEEKYIPEPNSGCWLWTASTFKGGYGQFWTGQKYTGAHRASYEMFRGEIAPKMQILHSCDNPLCVNPEHLSVGTNLDNQHDSIKKGKKATFKGETNPTHKLTMEQILIIREDNRPHGLIAKDFCISRSLVSSIKLRKKWKHI